MIEFKIEKTVSFDIDGMAEEIIAGGTFGDAVGECECGEEYYELSDKQRTALKIATFEKVLEILKGRIVF